MEERVMMKTRKEIFAKVEELGFMEGNPVEVEACNLLLDIAGPSEKTEITEELVEAMLEAEEQGGPVAAQAAELVRKFFNS